ncbi:MAG: hypothetical protein LBL59_07370, partial [Xanthomonadaceae bacterium]|nr:hypothetical protein [Xanthomonadaceae bacterium]
MAIVTDSWMAGAFAALKATLDVDARLKGEMIQFLLEEGFWDKNRLSWDAAVARFNAGLNPNKPEYFKIGELWALMAKFGRHQLFHAIAADLGYEVREIPTEQRRHDLLRQLTVAEQRHA